MIPPGNLYHIWRTAERLLQISKHWDNSFFSVGDDVIVRTLCFSFKLTLYFLFIIYWNVVYLFPFFLNVLYLLSSVSLCKAERGNVSFMTTFRVLNLFSRVLQLKVRSQE